MGVESRCSMHCNCNTRALNGCPCNCHEESLDQAIEALFLQGLISITCTEQGIGYIPTPAGIAVAEAIK